MALMVACSPSVKVPEDTRSVEGTSLELSAIDSLMWRQPDSALAQLQAFCNSPEADSLDEFNGHYCQLLISELLYKNDWGQSNREELLQAVAYFDSLVRLTPPLQRGAGGLKNTPSNLTPNLVFLDARAHYINGVGYYEQDSIVQACAEYLKALEVMEAHFEEKELVGEKARFMTLTHGRLGDMFSEQFMMDPSIMCYKNALVYCNIEPTSPTGISNLLTRLGVQYDKLGDKEKMRDCYGQALEAMPSCDNLSYRDLAASKAFCDYQLGLGIDHSLAALRRILVDADNEEERKTRFLAIGAMFAEERMYDSAMYYLEPLFENEDDIALKIPAAECLRNIYDSIGDNEKLDKCLHFMALRKKSEAQSKALVSQLDELMKSYTNQKLKNEAEKTREKAVRKAMNIVIPIAIGLVLVIIVLAKLRNKKSLKKQQEEADKVLGEAEQEHEKKLRLRQAVADKTLEETKKKYEGELRQLREETEQQLEEEERKHQQWMDKAKEQHEEELKVQKDLSEKEMGEIRKRHDEELEAVRQTHRMQQAALSGRLKRSNEELRELRDQRRQQTSNGLPKQETQAVSFNDEPICRLIMERVNEGQFKAKIDCELYKSYALDKQQLLDLRAAVDRHFGQFTLWLRKAYPKLTSIDIDYCCLYLLNLTHADVSALMQRAYNTVVRRDSKIQKILGSEKPISVILMDLAHNHSSV